MLGVFDALGDTFTHSIMAMDGNTSAILQVPHGVKVNLLTAPPKTAGPTYLLELYRTLRRAAPALLMTYNWGAMDALIAALVGRLCPIVHQEHGFGPDEAVRLKFRRVFARRIALKRIFKTLVVSKTLLDIALNQYRLPREKVTLIRNGVDTTRFSPHRDIELRHVLGAADDTLLCGYVGYLRPEKRLDFLIRAFAEAQIPNAKLVLVGEGCCRTKLESLSRALGVGDRIVFAGYAAGTARYYAAFDIFMMSSVTEQTPMSLLEAMASGLPALCTDVGDTAEMLESQNVPIVVPSTSFREYVKSLRMLAATPELRASLGTANRKRCELYYSQDRMARGFAAEWCAAVAHAPV
jgi:glycosyltransferase involved in cell wall biosynthesis